MEIICISSSPSSSSSSSSSSADELFIIGNKTAIAPFEDHTRSDHFSSSEDELPTVDPLKFAAFRRQWESWNIKLASYIPLNNASIVVNHQDARTDMLMTRTLDAALSTATARIVYELPEDDTVLFENRKKKDAIPTRVLPKDVPNPTTIPAVVLPVDEATIGGAQKALRQRVTTIRAPRTKSDSLNEIHLIIDARLDEAAPEIANAGRQALPSTRIETLPLPNTIVWKRFAWDQSEAEPLNPAPFIIYYLSIDELLPYLESRQKLEQYFAKLFDANYPRRFVVLTGAKKYAAKQALKQNRRFRDCLQNEQRMRKAMTEPSELLLAKIDEMLAMTALYLEFHLVYGNTEKDITSFIIELTRCVAWYPYSHGSSLQFNFCVKSQGRSGTNLTDTWRRMLTEIGRITPATADCIIEKYPSFASLHGCYKRMTRHDGEQLLASVLIGKRALGPVLSAKIHQIFTSDNPHLNIQ